jgi:xylulokinase
LLDL